jgi:hypothetical protein
MAPRRLSRRGPEVARRFDASGRPVGRSFELVLRVGAGARLTSITTALGDHGTLAVAWTVAPIDDRQAILRPFVRRFVRDRTTTACSQSRSRAPMARLGTATVTPERIPVLVTGGAGFIGSHLVDWRELVDGHRLAAADVVGATAGCRWGAGAGDGQRALLKELR